MEILEAMRSSEEDEILEQFEAALKLLKRSFQLYKSEPSVQLFLDCSSAESVNWP